MTARPVVAIVGIVLSSIVPIDPDPPIRAFVNVEVAPYPKGVALDIPFTYVSNMEEATNIAIYISNGEVTNLPLYVRAITISGSFSSTLAIDGRFLEGDMAAIHFVAWGQLFHQEQQLNIYARQTFNLGLGDKSPAQMTTVNHAIIDQYGVTRYLHESLSFSGFRATIERSLYVDIGLDMLSFNAQSEANLPVTIRLISLLIEDHQQNFSLLRRSVDQTHAYLNVRATLVDSTYRLHFQDALYVNPMTLISSYFPIAGFVATNRLFLPKDRYHDINPLRLRFQFKVTMGNIYDVDYESDYYFNQALLGSCSSSLYCVKTSNTTIDVGNWKEIIIDG
jgi:hypothetical protein